MLEEQAEKLENEIEDALKELSIPGGQSEAWDDIPDSDDDEAIVAVKPAVPSKFGVRAKARTSAEPEDEPTDAVALHYQDDVVVHEPLPVKEYEIPSRLLARWEARKKTQIPESMSERLDAVRKLRESTAVMLLMEQGRRLRFQKCFGM